MYFPEMPKVHSSTSSGKPRFFCPWCQTTFKTSLSSALWRPKSDAPLGSQTYVNAQGVSANAFEDHREVTYQLFGFDCYKCKKVTIEVQRSESVRGSNGGDSILNTEVIQIRPFGGERVPPPEVPEPISKVFREATSISKLSTLGSAVLARRCLQATLRHTFPKMPRQKTLFAEIEWVEKNSDLSSVLKGVLHSMRLAGNFGAHPDEDEAETANTDVSPEVLEACFAFLLTLFHERYVEPGQRAAIFEKLKTAFPHGSNGS